MSPSGTAYCDSWSYKPFSQETPDAPEALNCIPSLQLSDIPKEVTPIPTDISSDQVRSITPVLLVRSIPFHCICIT